MVRQPEPSIPLVALWDETTWIPDSPWLNRINPAAVGEPIIGATMVGANILSPGYSVPYGQTPRDPGRHANGLRGVRNKVSSAIAKKPPIARNGFETPCG